MGMIPGLRQVRDEQARRDRRVMAQQAQASALERRADHVVRKVTDSSDRLANEMRTLGQVFRQ